MKGILRSFLLSFVFLFILIVFTVYHSVEKEFPDNLRVRVEKGENLRSLLRKLKNRAGFSDFDLVLLYYYARVSGKDRIKSGTYLALKGESLLSFLKKVNSGRAILIRVTIPEGFNSYQIGELLDKKRVCRYEDFIRYAFSRLTAEKYGIHSDRVEGFLFPDTYEFSEDMNAEQVIRVMVENFWKHYPEEFKKREKELGWDTYRVVTLASIIQKETSKVEEMPLVSAVYHNRLKKGMLLQADPTVIYGLYPNFDGNLKKKDLLDRSNRWNTYVYKGLPPTPICNPGLLAIKAALYPASVDYLYFVAKGDGTHYFSRTYEEHRKAVYRYQIKKK